MKLIDISTRRFPGIFTMVDDEDFDFLSAFKWNPADNKDSNTLYAVRSIRKPRKTVVRMHRIILGPGALSTVDHIDGNGLNNQRSNLRLATSAENNRNLGMRRNNTSGYKGAFWDKYINRWKASIRINKIQKHLGVYADVITAAKAYDVAALKYHGEFARLNFPEDKYDPA